MKFLITGGSGFIGTGLIEELALLNVEIMNIDIAEPNLEAHKTYWQKCDILNLENLFQIFAEFEPTHVVHLAARTDTLSDDIEDYFVNTAGTDNVLAAIKRTKTVERTIITTTQFVNQYNGPPKHDQDYAPHTAYGESKVLNEKATRESDLECPWTIIRPTNIWGPWHLRYPHEFWRVLGKGMYFHPDGEPVIRSYGYIKNVVYQIIQISKAPKEKIDGKVYYVGDRPLDLLDWVNGFSVGLRGKKVTVVPRVLIRGLAVFGDLLLKFGLRFPITSSRFKSMTTSNDAPMGEVIDAFGPPPYTLAEGIAETVNWLKQYHPDLVKTELDQLKN